MEKHRLPNLQQAIETIAKDGRLSETQWRQLDKELAQKALKAGAAFLRPLRNPGDTPMK